MVDWNEQCDSFRFVLPTDWHDLLEEDLRRLSDQEGCRVWAAAEGGTGERLALVHVTIVPGSLDDYVDLLVSESWGTADHTTRVGGPFLTVIGGVDAAVLEYACLDYGAAEPGGTDRLPRHMSLVLVVAELSGYLFRISLYTPAEDLSERGVQFQTMLDTWLWADMVLLGDGNVA